MDNDRLAEVERQNALLQIHLEWERERQGLLFRGAEPRPLFFITPIAVTSIASLAMLALAFQAGVQNGLGFVVVAMSLLIGGAIGTAYHYRKYSEFTRAKGRYSQRRAAIEQPGGAGKLSDDASGGRTA